VAFVRECQRRGLKLNYVAHVTGHGWRKLMRLDAPFVYEITAPHPPGALFDFLLRAGPVELREAYATFNMGIGFAAYVAPESADAVLAAARAHVRGGHAAVAVGRRAVQSRHGGILGAGEWSGRVLECGAQHRRGYARLSSSRDASRIPGCLP
jgi:phosphoribosylformylglycinamidine cyclo-ligase